MDINRTYNVDCIEGAMRLPDKCIDCIVTSPPYYGLRDYGVDGQIGLEDTPDQYIDKLVRLFRELRRVLKDEGTVWINIADSYAGSGRGAGDTKRNSEKQRSNSGSWIGDKHKPFKSVDIKPKDLIGIPWMLAFALRADGWYLRQDIIWHKPNAMPESVTDRCSKSHEYIFLFSKSKKYYFDADAIRQPAKPSTIARLSQDVEHQKGSFRVPGKTNGPMKAVIGGRKRVEANSLLSPDDPMFRSNTYREYEYTGCANKRSVWTVPTRPFKEAHFATYPPELITDCIKAGCPEGGIVLDPFNGSGTTRIVANKLGRNSIGFELNPEYIKIEENRRRNELGIFNQ